MSRKKQIENQIKHLIATEIDTIDNSIENLQSMPGVSYKIISAILGECGDLKRFDSAKAFIGYPGLYPTQYQSGNSLSVGRLLCPERYPYCQTCSLYDGCWFCIA